MGGPLTKGDFTPAPDCRATSTTSCILRHCSSSLRRLPSKVDANPHCGLRARLSRGTYRLASSMRWMICALGSRSATLLLINPSTTPLSLGTKRSGSKVPARSDSYSSRNRSTFSSLNSFSAIGS